MLFRSKIEDKDFQKLIVDVMKSHKDELKHAYDCDSLRDLDRIKGEIKGIQHFFNTLKGVQNELINIKKELDSCD